MKNERSDEPIVWQYSPEWLRRMWGLDHLAIEATIDITKGIAYPKKTT